MLNYNKYLKYKNKYLQLKKIQEGGKVSCDRGYKNLLGTCWAVSIQMIVTFGQATSENLEYNMKNLDFTENYINKIIQKVIDNPELKNLFPCNTYDVNRNFLEIILDKFIDRYYNKVFNINLSIKPIKIHDEENMLRCEYLIKNNFLKLFRDLHINSIITGTNHIIDQYLFTNLLTVFFLGYKVSFRKYYDNFNLINFDFDNDLGILIAIERHMCCLFICNGQQKYYNDWDRKVYNCEWECILKSTNNLYIEKDFPLRLIDYDSYNEKRNLRKVDSLTVVSKYKSDSLIDIEIKKILKSTIINHKDIEDSELLYWASFKNKFYDFKRYMNCMTKSAQKGYPEAQFELGEILYSINKEKGLKWFHLAANQSHSQAQYKLGLLYSGNHGIEKKSDEAERWLILSSYRYNKNNQDALTLLERMLDEGIIQDQAEVVLLIIENSLEKKKNIKSTFIKKIIDGNIPHGNANAQYILGNIFYNGIGFITQNKNLAFYMFLAAAEQQNIQAQLKLGDMFYKGDGVTQDINEAVKWYRLAAEKGN